jgi:hypothetical protein
MTWKSYAAVSGAGLLATYLFSTPPTGVPARPGVARTPDATRPAPPAFDIAAEAARLRERVPPDVPYDEPSRNPFRFGARPTSVSPRRAEPSPPPPVLTPSAPVPQPPPIRLSGIATTTVDGTRQRTAILITPGGIQYAREGDAVGADYRVARIDEDAIELTGSDGSSRRLLLRP